MPGPNPYRPILAAAALLLLASCTAPTPYGPATDRGGFTDQPIEANRFRVSFSGNTHTSRDTVETYLLYRAAEVTLASGNDWFQIAERDTEVETRFTGFTNEFGGRGFGSSFHRSGAIGGGVTTTARPINRYMSFATILVFPGDKPAENPQAYDAADVIATLGDRIIRSQDTAS